MWLKIIITLLTTSVVALAIIGYTPLPAGVKDPVKTQIFMGCFKIFHIVMQVREYLGYGSVYNNIRVLQRERTLVGDPPSSKYGDIKVTRDKIADVPVIIYRPPTRELYSPALIYFHGGGWVLGTADEMDTKAYNYAKATNMTVINVDYRRAPQFPFPIPIQDCLDVTRYILQKGDEYGIDVNSIGVAGESAGGNAAAVVALILTKTRPDLPLLKFQVLSYPSLQGFDFRLPSYVDYQNTMPCLTAKLSASFRSLYFGLDEHKTDYYAKIFSENRHISPEFRKSKYSEYVNVNLLPKEFRTPNKTAPVVTEPYDPQVAAKVEPIIVNPLFSPLMAPDLSGLPLAYIHVCEFDVLRDDALMYARRLKDAGVSVTLHFGYGGYHADTLVPELLQSESGKAGFETACAFINSQRQV
ncbi:arylacetamide deacetylase-like [Physella acuta]|uniref:arylacetamide deacetylase-like n=1 Tax=Physella acuta TaxID=109671 RepID=UPI0027DBB4C8|nr:arylacetamide deacetylase-like [Physella acuta]